MDPKSYGTPLLSIISSVSFLKFFSVPEENEGQYLCQSVPFIRLLRNLFTHAPNLSFRYCTVTQSTSSLFFPNLHFRCYPLVFNLLDCFFSHDLFLWYKPPRACMGCQKVGGTTFSSLIHIPWIVNCGVWGMKRSIEITWKRKSNFLAFIQLFPERISYKMVKEYATMPNDITSSESLPLLN